MSSVTIDSKEDKVISFIYDSNYETLDSNTKMDFSNEPHEFNEDDNVLWLTQHDSEEDVHRKIETFDSLSKYSDSILDCFEHCKEALMILEDNVICAVTGRILL